VLPILVLHQGMPEVTLESPQTNLAQDKLNSHMVGLIFLVLCTTCIRFEGTLTFALIHAWRRGEVRHHTFDNAANFGQLERKKERKNSRLAVITRFVLCNRLEASRLAESRGYRARFNIQLG